MQNRRLSDGDQIRIRERDRHDTRGDCFGQGSQGEAATALQPDDEVTMLCRFPLQGESRDSHPQGTEGNASGVA